MKNKKTIWLLLAISLLLASCSSSDLGSIEVAPNQGAIAPPFELRTLEDETISLDDYRGRVVLVNFWATWCGPCRFEMPAIQDRFENTELEVLAINFDESEELVRPFVDELALSFPILMDPGATIQHLYQVRGYPTSVFVNKEGVIQIIHIGLMDEAQLDGYLDELGVAN